MRIGRKIGVSLMATLFLMLAVSPASAQEVRQEVETKCSGGNLVSSASASNGQVRLSDSEIKWITCAVSSPMRMYVYGIASPETRDAMVRFNNATGPGTKIVAAKAATTTWQVLSFTVDVPAGTTSISFARAISNQQNPVLDFYTTGPIPPPPDTTPPSVPSSLAVTASNGPVVVSWAPSTDNSGGSIKYRVTETSTAQTSGTGPLTFFTMSTTTETTNTTYTSSLPNTVDQEFSIVAVDDAGNTSDAATITYTAPPPPPPPPPSPSPSPPPPTEEPPTDDEESSLLFCQTGNFAGDLCYQFVSYVAPPALGLTALLLGIGALISYGRTGLR